MRKVNERINVALRRGVAYKDRANTRCDEHGNVYLHENHIVRHALTGRMEFNLCGWHTPTTIDRLNALLTPGEGNLIWLEHKHAYRGSRSIKPVPCPRGVDPKAHGELHKADDEREALPDSGWFSAYRSKS